MWKMFLICIIGAPANFSIHLAAQEAVKRAENGRTEKEMETLRAMDAEVVEAVLVDMMLKEDSPLEVGDSERKEIWVSETLDDIAPTLENLVSQYDEKGKAIKKEQDALRKEPALDLIRRAKDKDLLSPFVPSDKRIQVYTKKEHDTGKDRDRLLDRRQVFTFNAPGYSKDKRFAAVHFSFPWSVHFGMGTYYLEKRDKKWVVILRQTFYAL